MANLLNSYFYRVLLLAQKRFIVHSITTLYRLQSDTEDHMDIRLNGLPILKRRTTFTPFYFYLIYAHLNRLRHRLLIHIIHIFMVQ